MKYPFLIPVYKSVMFLAVAGITASFSCSKNASSEITPVEIQPPEVLELNGVNWRRADSLGASDSNLLSRYFEMNPSMVDSPTMKGPPTVYHATKKRRRFFWVRGTATEPIWVCVHFAKHEFQLLEGQGNPYQNSSR